MFPLFDFSNLNTYWEHLFHQTADISKGSRFVERKSQMEGAIWNKHIASHETG